MYSTEFNSCTYLYFSLIKPSANYLVVFCMIILEAYKSNSFQLCFKKADSRKIINIKIKQRNLTIETWWKDILFSYHWLFSHFIFSYDFNSDYFCQTCALTTNLIVHHFKSFNTPSLLVNTKNYPKTKSINSPVN
jgi:hypothetical protein